MSSRRGRPPIYSEKIAEEIFTRLASGESLRAICKDEHMPTDALVHEWARADSEERPRFVERYVRAREVGYEHLADGLLELANSDCTVDGEPNTALVQQARLRVDTLKWLLSKRLPRQYGDRLTAEIVGDADRPVISRIELIPIAPKPRPEADEAAGVSEAAAPPLRAITSR